MYKLEKHQPPCLLLRAVMASNDLVDLSPPDNQSTSAAIQLPTLHTCALRAPGSLPHPRRPDMPFAGPVHPCVRKMSPPPGRHHGADAVLPVPVHLVRRTWSGHCGTMTLGAVHAHRIPIFLPLLPPPGVGHDGRALKQLRSRSRAEPSSQECQRSTKPAAAGPPLHPDSSSRRELCRRKPPSPPVPEVRGRVRCPHLWRGASIICTGEGDLPGPGPERPGRCPQGRAVTKGTRPGGRRLHDTCGGRAGSRPGGSRARS